MWKIYVGNLESGIRERELADAFRTYGDVRSVWVARNPPGYAFVELNDRRDAEDAIAALDGRHGWRVEMSKKSVGSSEPRCFQCGSSRHFARDCRYRSSRRSSRRSPSPYSRRDSARGSLSRIERGGELSPRYDRRGSPRYSPLGRGRNYERASGSDRSESRGSYRRRRERSISPEDTKVRVKSPGERVHSKSPEVSNPEIDGYIKSPEVSNPEIDGSERGPEQSRSPQSIRSDIEGSLEMRERSRSPPSRLRSSPDGSPVRNGSVHSKSPTGKNDLDMEDDRIPAVENNGDADPSDM